MRCNCEGPEPTKVTIRIPGSLNLALATEYPEKRAAFQRGIANKLREQASFSGMLLQTPIFMKQWNCDDHFHVVAEAHGVLSDA